MLPACVIVFGSGCLETVCTMLPALVMEFGAPWSKDVPWSLAAGVHHAPLMCHGDVFTNICMYMLHQHTFEFSKSVFVC